MLQGRDGHQSKELSRLTDWLKSEAKPDVILLTNVLLSGMVPELKQTLEVPVLATLQGDDIFLDALHTADRTKCIDLIRSNCETLDGLIATSSSYADHMSDYLGIERDRIEVIPPGINLEGHGGPRSHRSDYRPAIGFFARIAPEKGLHNLVDAFIELRKSTKAPVLRVSGWLGEQHKPYLEAQKAKLAAAGLLQDFEHVESPDHATKVRFLSSLDVLSVPTDYHEPKGLYVLEAWANGVPVVLPGHGCFPELIAATGGGILVPANDTQALAEGLSKYIQDRELGRLVGEGAKAIVAECYTAEAMARTTAAHLERFAVPAGAVR